MGNVLSLDSFDVGVDNRKVEDDGEGELEGKRRWEVIKKFTIGDLDV